MQLRNRCIGTAVSVIVLAVAFASCGGGNGSGTSTTFGSTSPNKALTSVSIGSIPQFTVTTWPLLIAQEQGYFRQQGISPQFTWTFDGVAPLAAGKVDFLNTGADRAVAAAAAGAKTLVLWVTADRLTDGLLVNKSIHSVSQFVGKTIGVSGIGNPDWWVVRQYLAQHGVSPSSVQYLAVSSDAAIKAEVSNGRLAAGMIDEESLYSANGQFGVMLPPTAGVVYPWNAIQTTQAFADSHRAVVVGFLRALIEAVRFLQNPANKAKVIKDVVALGGGETTSDATLSYNAAQHYWPNFSVYHRGIVVPSEITPAVSVLAAEGQSTKRVHVAGLIDNSFYQQALNGLNK